MYQAEALFMKHRWDSMNMITIDIPVEPLHEYVNKKRKTDNPTNHLAIIIAAYVRTLAKYPELNRFVVNKKFYARNEITVGMVVLNKNTGEGDMNKMYFEPTDTLDIVTAKINKYIEDSKELWQNCLGELPIATVGCSIGAHVGPGAVAVAFFEK